MITQAVDAGQLRPGMPVAIGSQRYEIVYTDDRSTLIESYHGQRELIRTDDVNWLEVLDDEPIPKPEWLTECWLNFDEDGTRTFHHSEVVADRDAHADRYGRMSCDNGEWVPCAGRKPIRAINQVAKNARKDVD